MKTFAVLLVLAVAAVSALPTPSEETKESREGRTITFGTVGSTVGIRTPPVPALTIQHPGLSLPGLQFPAMSLTLPQHPGLQIQPELVQSLLNGVAQFIGAVVQNAVLA